jgi:hypothetical protein
MTDPTKDFIEAARRGDRDAMRRAEADASAQLHRAHAEHGLLSPEAAVLSVYDATTPGADTLGTLQKLVAPADRRGARVTVDMVLDVEDVTDVQDVVDAYLSGEGETS